MRRASTAGKRSSMQRMTPLSTSDSIYHPLTIATTITIASTAVATTRLVIRNYSREGEARFSKRVGRLTDGEVISLPRSIFPTGRNIMC